MYRDVPWTLYIVFNLQESSCSGNFRVIFRVGLSITACFDRFSFFDLALYITEKRIDQCGQNFWLDVLVEIIVVPAGKRKSSAGSQLLDPFTMCLVAPLFRFLLISEG